VQIVLLIAHPRPNSFNHALAAVAREVLQTAGHEVWFHDLYAEKFDPLLTAEECYTTGSSVESVLASCTDELVRAHRQQISSAQGLVVIHPNWWGKPPAILAGWLDRVLVPGVAYRLKDATGEPEPLLSLHMSAVINTSDTPAEREAAHLGDPLDSIWRRCVLPYCGAKHVERRLFGPVTDSTAQDRALWLATLAVDIAKWFPANS
jgi:NAD(P)H dehydrogenase (quinone)